MAMGEGDAGGGLVKVLRICVLVGDDERDRVSVSPPINAPRCLAFSSLATSASISTKGCFSPAASLVSLGNFFLSIFREVVLDSVDEIDPRSEVDLLVVEAPSRIMVWLLGPVAMEAVN